MTDSFDFFLEEAAWPFVHVLVPAAVYIETREIVWSLLLIYASETVEAVLRPFFVEFGETLTDSLVGDIIVGSMAIGALWLYDIYTGAAPAFRDAEPIRVRVLGLILPSVYSAIFLVDLAEGSRIDWRVLLFYAFYALTFLAIHSRSIFWPRRGTRDNIAGRALLVWLAAAFVYAALALPVTDGTRTFLTRWMRMFYTLSFFLLLSFGAAFVRLFTNDDDARVSV